VNKEIFIWDLNHEELRKLTGKTDAIESAQFLLHNLQIVENNYIINVVEIPNEK
jgi:hypothetical protein